jgi:hypothetical protein
MRGVVLLTCLALSAQARGQSVHVEVVDPAGAPVPARIDVRAVDTVERRDETNQLFRVEARQERADPDGSGTSDSTTSRLGLHGVVAWTAQGYAWQQVELKAGETAQARLVVEPAGQVTIRNSFPDDARELPFDSYTVDVTLYRDGFCWGSIEVPVTKAARGSGTIARMQPGTYTVVGRAVSGRFTFVKQSVRVQSGRSVDVTIPGGGGSLGGVLCEAVDARTRQPVADPTLRLLLPDQPVVVHATETSATDEGRAFSGWCELSVGRYRVLVEAPGRAPSEHALSVARGRERTTQSPFGERRIEREYARETLRLAP